MTVQRIMRTYSNDRALSWSRQLFAGVLLVLTALLIILMPEILVAVVASIVMLAGISLIAGAWRSRKAPRDASAYAVYEAIEW